jgi:hypothetical protein
LLIIGMFLYHELCREIYSPHKLYPNIFSVMDSSTLPFKWKALPRQGILQSWALANTDDTIDGNLVASAVGKT